MTKNGGWDMLEILEFIFSKWYIYAGVILLIILTGEYTIAIIRALMGKK